MFESPQSELAHEIVNFLDYFVFETVFKHTCLNQNESLEYYNRPTYIQLSGLKVMAIICGGHNDFAIQLYLIWDKFLSHFSYAHSIGSWSTGQLSIL